MSIRVKLLLTYTILVIISATVLIFSGIAIVTGLLVKTADAVIEDTNFEVVFTSVIDILAELKQAEDYDPEKLINPEFIKEISSKADFYKGGIIVRYKGTVYNYSKLPNSPAFYDGLKKGDLVHQHVEDQDFETNHVVSYQNQDFVYLPYAFSIKNSDVEYYFVANITKVKSVSSESGRSFLSVIVFILIIIMAPLLVILTNDIIKPIKKLEIGVRHIKEGNLNYKIETKKINEIGKVITYFDDMRQELKQSIDKQIAYEENRKELISSISHDLKTPITSIKGYVEGIRDGVANTPEKLNKYLDVIYQKSNDMDRLIDDLFLFSKLDLDRLPFEKQEVNILPLINAVVNEMKIQWENESQKINLILNAEGLEDLRINIDQQEMKRVFLNIIQNSMNYMDKPQQEISVSLTDNADYLQIVIADNGKGIDGEHLDHIFDRFYRVDESRNSATGGSGLGLAIAKQIIEQHGGKLFAASELGKGTKIIIELLKQDPSKKQKGDTNG